MKTIHALLFAAMFSCQIKTQNSSANIYFTGQVGYEYTYESTKLNPDSLAKTKFSKSLFRFDSRDYQSQFIGKDTFSYSYSGETNHCLSETNHQKNYECEDYGPATDSILYYQIYGTDEKVLGHPCFTIEWQGKYFWNKYWVASDLRIAPGTYEKHLAYNWQFYGKKTGGGVILKLEHRFKNYTMHGIATSIETGGKKFRALEMEPSVFDQFCKKP